MKDWFLRTPQGLTALLMLVTMFLSTVLGVLIVIFYG